MRCSNDLLRTDIVYQEDEIVAFDIIETVTVMYFFETTFKIRKLLIIFLVVKLFINYE